MTTVRAATASVKLTDDNMVALNSKQTVFNRPYEGEFRANAMIIEASQKRVCLVSCDALKIPSQAAQSTAQRIAETINIPSTHVLICATHQHGGPVIGTKAGGQPNYEYLRRVEEGSVIAAAGAAAKLEDENACGGDASVEILHGLSQEATVGRNSRLLLRDGSIGWKGYREEDVVRPTGPYDPDLHLLALRQSDGTYAGLFFNHSVHNNIKVRGKALSPCVYGMAALEIEKQYGAATLFLPGAIGSTHNRTYIDSGVPGSECVYRIVSAVNEALNSARIISPANLQILHRMFKFRVRKFDEKKESEAVKYYLETYTPDEAEKLQEYHRKRRAALAPHQGEERQTALQVILIGDVALVGIPGQLFGSLGLELRRRSPFRHTVVVGLANGAIGYIPDRKAFDVGGYQTWVGMTDSAPGTGEAMVEQALAMLKELHWESVE